MKSKDALRVLAEITAHQWGMVTAAQAGTHGVTRLDLSRLTAAGHLERLAHGVYKDAGAPPHEFDDLRAAWLSTEPKIIGEARLRDRAKGVVVAGSSAARLHEIGDLWADHHEFVSYQRRQTQRAEIRYRRRSLAAQDVTLVHGLPTMTMERTIADLLEEVGDLSLVGDALRDAALKRPLDLARLSELLAPLAERNGFKKRDGSALLDRLLDSAGLSADSVARRVATSSLGSRVVASYLDGLSADDLESLMRAPGMQSSLEAIRQSVAATFEGAVEVAALGANARAALDTLINTGAFDDIVQTVTAQLVHSNAIRNLARDWGTSPTASAVVPPEALAAIRTAQKLVADVRV